MLWEAWELAVEGAPSRTSVLSQPPWRCIKDGQPLMLPFREWLSPLAHLPAAILAGEEPKRGSAWGQGISALSILYCLI